MKWTKPNISVISPLIKMRFDAFAEFAQKPGLKVKTQRHFLQVAEKWELSAANADLQNRLQTMAITYMQGRPDDNMLQVLLHIGRDIMLGPLN